MRHENRELNSKLEVQRRKTSSACKTPVGAVLRFQRGIARIASKAQYRKHGGVRRENGTRWKGTADGESDSVSIVAGACGADPSAVRSRKV